MTMPRVRAATLFLVGASLLTGLLAAPSTAQAQTCWKCFYYLVKGNELFPPYSFELCSPYDGGNGPWDCYMIGEDCYNFGACDDYVFV